MSRKKPSLSEVLEYLKLRHNGDCLNKTIKIFGTEDNESEVLLKSAKLRDFCADYQYKVTFWYQESFNPDVIDIWVKIKK